MRIRIMARTAGSSRPDRPIAPRLGVKREGSRGGNPAYRYLTGGRAGIAWKEVHHFAYIVFSAVIDGRAGSHAHPRHPRHGQGRTDRTFWTGLVGRTIGDAISSWHGGLASISRSTVGIQGTRRANHGIHNARIARGIPSISSVLHAARVGHVARVRHARWIVGRVLRNRARAAAARAKEAYPANPQEN